MSHNALTSQLAIAATRAVQAVAEETRRSIEDLRETEYYRQAEKISSELAFVLEQTLAGTMDARLAREQAFKASGEMDRLAKVDAEEGNIKALTRVYMAFVNTIETTIVLVEMSKR